MDETTQQGPVPQPPTSPPNQGGSPPQPPPMARPPKSGAVKGCLIAIVLCGVFLFLAVVALAVIGAAVGSAGLGGMQRADGVAQLREVTISGRSGWPKVVCVSVQGIILGSSMPGMEYSPAALFTEELRLARENKRVVGVLIYVDSPGGGITASDIMYEELRRFRKETGKPVVVCIMDVAASGGYYVAAGADVIVAHPTTITGSIGVIMSSYDASELLKKIGIKDESIASGEYKDLLSPTAGKEPDQKAKEQAMVRTMIMQMRERFVDVVAEGRSDLSREEVDKLADGRIFTAQQALDNGLIDKIGYQKDAIAEVKKLSGEADVQLVHYRRPPSLADLFGSMVKAPEIRLDLGNGLPAGPKPMFLWRPGLTDGEQ